MEDGRKIHPSIENPIDNFLIDAGTWVNRNIFSPTYVSPNGLTTASLMFGLLGAYALYHQQYVVSAVLVAIAYFFDCCDGNFARMYDMSTEFGDFYDHISDTVKTLTLFIAIYYLPLARETKVCAVIVMSLALLCSFVHLGCQEQIYDKPSESKTLSILKYSCTHHFDIAYTRYLGCGTATLIMVLMIATLPHIDTFFQR